MTKRSLLHSQYLDMVLNTLAGILREKYIRLPRCWLQQTAIQFPRRDAIKIIYQDDMYKFILRVNDLRPIEERNKNIFLYITKYYWHKQYKSSLCFWDGYWNKKYMPCYALQKFYPVPTY